MKNLYLDIETFSSESIAEAGNYRYAMSPDFEILLVAYAYDNDPVQVIDLGKGIQELSVSEANTLAQLVRDILDPNVIKHAHNAVFERVCFTMWLRREEVLPPQAWLNPRQWRCTMVKCARAGLPLSLDQAGAALGLKDQKMKEGKRLIQLFCTPRKTKTTGGLFGPLPDRVQPDEHPEDWEVFKQYCIRDVEVEIAINRALSWVPVSDFENELYAIDQEINDHGVLVDVELAQNATRIDTTYKARLNTEAVRITGLTNPNSVTQLKEWIQEQTGIVLNGLSKADLPDLINATKDNRVRRVLKIRQEMGKTSCSKYDAMLRTVGPDNRVRGLMQFYGTRTGRWAGRLVQMQNLPQNHIKDLDFARELLESNDEDLMQLCYGNVPEVLSQLIRTAFIAPEGKTFAVCDFSAIEARVIAWLTGENWVLDVFRNGGDIYCATASNMFHVPVEKHGQNAELRQKGKIAVLALGYGGGVSALDKMGGQRMGLTEDEEKEIVRKWRDANPNIAKFWSTVEDTVRSTLAFKIPVKLGDRLTFRMVGSTLCCELPSGRWICYPKMEISFEEEYAFIEQTDKQKATDQSYIVKEKKSLHLDKYYRSGGSRLRYMSLNQTTHKWEWTETYGGKLTENIVQAIARDCLAETMTAVHKQGYPIVFHVHDELICEVDGEKDLEAIEEIFKHEPAWADGLPLKGAGYTTPYYLKD